MALTFYPGGRVRGPVPSVHLRTPGPREGYAGALHKIFREATSPTVFLGIGLGQLGWGAGRYLGVKGARTLGVSGGRSLWAGRAIGLAAEAGAWTALGVGGRSRPPWAAEWLATGTTVASLRSVSALLAGKHPLALALGAYVALAGSQAFLGKTLFHENRSLGQIMESSLAFMLGLHLAAPLTRVLYGSALAQMDLALSGKTLEVQNSVGKHRGGAGGISPQSQNWAYVLPKVSSPRTPWLLHMAKGPPESPFRPLPISSAPTSGPRPKGGRGTLADPYPVADVPALKAYVRDPAQDFFGRIGRDRDHFYFIFPSGEKFPLLEVMEFFNRLEFSESPPRGRLIQVQFEDGSRRLDFIFTGKDFRVGKTGPSTPVLGSMGIVTPPGTKAEFAGPPLRPRRIPPTPPESPGAMAKGSLPMVFDLLREIRVLTATFQAARGPKSIELFLNSKNALESGELTGLREVMKGAPEGSQLLLHDPRGRRSYALDRKGNEVKGDVHFWERPQDPLQLKVRNLLEVFQQLSFSRELRPRPDTSLRVEFGSRWRPLQDGGELIKFLNIQISHSFPPILLHDGARLQAFHYNPGRRLWEKELFQ